MTESPTPTSSGAGELLAVERSRCVKPCDVCEGEGEIADGLDEAACSMPCPRCDGNAWLVDLGRLSALGPPPTEVREGPTNAMIAAGERVLIDRSVRDPEGKWWGYAKKVWLAMEAERLGS